MSRTGATCLRCTALAKSRGVAMSSSSGRRWLTPVVTVGSAALNENITASQKPARMSVLR
jgi:hypothetical protein